MRYGPNSRTLYSEQRMIVHSDIWGIAVICAKKCALAAVLSPLLAGLLVATPATAAPRGPGITHPQDDWAGSQIAKHEGGGNFRPMVGPLVATSTSSVSMGMDVSSHQGNVNWTTAAHNGAKFAYVKATEAGSYASPFFAQQYNGSYKAGLIRGAYHFATPNSSPGAAQANWFVNHGGGWSADGRTLPPAVDLEYNPYGQSCYSMKPAALVSWVRAFVNTVHARTKRWPVIYTSTSWWSLCMAGYAGFTADPLWIARYNSHLGTVLPHGWRTWTIWQYADAGRFPGDQNEFHGTLTALRALARG
jgi:GH25 family lysozyme M1 (1,4-beta-N-acetylmuramidase)